MKFNPTNHHFIEKKPDAASYRPDREPLPPPGREPLRPLHWGLTGPSRETNYDLVRTMFQGLSGDSRVFLDTGFITSHEISWEVWEALLSKQVFITVGVWKELQPWVNNPKCNAHFRDYLVRAIQLEESGKGHGHVSLASTGDLTHGLSAVAQHYVRLLWMRKFFAILQRERFRSENGRYPEIPEIQSHCQKVVGSRGWRIANKVLQEPATPISTVDEELVVNAAFHAILFGKPTFVCTRDNDVFEQFYKVLYLIDSHYRGMLLAEKYRATPNEFQVFPFPKLESGSSQFAQAFPGEGNVALSSGGLDYLDLVPKSAVPVQCYCGLMSTNDRPLMLSQKDFGVIADLQRLLRVKASTKGRNTDLFGTMNFHIELDPRRYFFGRSGPGLVNDGVIDIEYAPGEFPIAWTDAELAIFTNEAFCTEVFQYADA